MATERNLHDPVFHPRRTVVGVEEGSLLAPRFPMDGLMPCVTTDAGDGVVLMIGWMNAAALERTIKRGEAHYFSRTRQAVWHKGATSGLVQRVIEMRIDDDQDAIWLRVDVAGNGGSCHVGYRSCFYRRVPVGPDADGALTFSEDRKLFDPAIVYGDAPNPTIL
ncbi:phosphoribosyl-AMP cyclohydrolase [Yoonia vestfoldensis]|uniref:phosphoribosyl-AMP cyclohydrolase n=1 Tax=Yoonia vestfoldensis TaxID=245188 RepID=UPI000477EEAF|nr:phosphoribosyl-AMP cyclohydrolase [Yoonia vestfoldensis]